MHYLAVIFVYLAVIGHDCHFILEIARSFKRKFLELDVNFYVVYLYSKISNIPNMKFLLAFQKQTWIKLEKISLQSCATLDKKECSLELATLPDEKFDGSGALTSLFVYRARVPNLDILQ